FERRQASERELAQLGELAEPVLRRALGAGISAESRRRVERLLDYRRMFVNPEALRRARSVYVLEKGGTAGARQLLQTLAAGDRSVRSTRHAADALKRLRE